MRKPKSYDQFYAELQAQAQKDAAARARRLTANMDSDDALGLVQIIQLGVAILGIAALFLTGAHYMGLI